MNYKELQNVYGKWLNEYDWTHFITLTSNSRINIKQAHEYINQFYWRLALGNSSMKMFWVAEPHKNKGYHLHALIKMPGHYRHESTLKNEWQKIVKSKVHIHIDKYDKDKGANYYIVKYIVNSYRETDWHIILPEKRDTVTSLRLPSILSLHY